MQKNWGNSQLLMVESQIDNLIPGLFLGHNLCFKCPNESCEPILYIYVPKSFQWYKELFNPIGFDLCNHSLKIQESIGTLIPKMGAHLGMWGFIPSHFPTFIGAWNVTPGLPSWPAPLQTLTLVVNLRLRLQHLLQHHVWSLDWMDNNDCCNLHLIVTSNVLWCAHVSTIYWTFCH
jgi:hypothetical protein